MDKSTQPLSYKEVTKNSYAIMERIESCVSWDGLKG